MQALSLSLHVVDFFRIFAVMPVSYWSNVGVGVGVGVGVLRSLKVELTCYLVCPFCKSDYYINCNGIASGW